MDLLRELQDLSRDGDELLVLSLFGLNEELIPISRQILELTKEIHSLTKRW